MSKKIQVYLIPTLLLFLTACVATDEKPSEFENIVMSDMRTPASTEYIDRSFKTYFGSIKVLDRKDKIQHLVNKIISEMPVKGEPRLRPLLIFQEVTKNERSEWGEILQHFKILDKIGIYLTSSGVFTKDFESNDFYYQMLSKAMAELESELNKNTLLYRPEEKELHESEAKLRYNNRLAGDVRLSLKNKNLVLVETEKILLDRTLKNIEKAHSIESIGLIKKTNEFKKAVSSLSFPKIESSSDIDGFANSVDLELQTKFNMLILQDLI